jgi:hypothetical protein
MKKLFGISALGLAALIGQPTLYSQNNDTLPQVGDTLPSEQGSEIENGGGYYPNDEEPWFGAEGLQEELELDDDQVRRLNDAYGSTWKQMRANQSDSGNDLDEQARGQRLNEYRDRFDDEFNRSTSDVFRNDTQRNRFNQLRMQYQGYGAFNNPRTRAQYNLNDTQIRQLEELNNEWNNNMNEFRNTYANDREGTTSRFNDYNASARTRFEGILNDQQRQRYGQDTGEQFNFGADAYLRQNGTTRLGTQNSGAGVDTGLGTSRTGTGPNSGTGAGTSGAGAGVGTGTGSGTSGAGSGTGTGTGTGTSGAGSGTGTGTGTGTSGSGS